MDKKSNEVPDLKYSTSNNGWIMLTFLKAGFTNFPYLMQLKIYFNSCYAGWQYICMYLCVIHVRTTCIYYHSYKLCQSRLTIVSREAKKKQRPLSELFTWTTTKKLGNAQTKPPWKLAPSYYRPNTFLLPRINKPIMVEIASTVLKFWLLRV